MDRVLQNTPTVLTVTFYVDGVATDPTPQTVTVTLTRADGTNVVTAAAATRVSAGVYSYPLSAAVTATLDQLAGTWVSTNLGTLTSEHEIVGGYLFTVSQLRAFSNNAFADTVKYPTAELVRIRTDVEVALERELGYALVPRYERATVTAQSQYIQLKPYTRTIRSLSSAGATIDTSALPLSETGYVAGTYNWPVVVGYEHGLDANSDTTRRMQRAGLMLAKAWLQDSPVDDRASTFSSVDGGTYGLVVPGRGGSTFGVPDVDVAVERERFVAIG
jgi:hypothetical protein